MNIPFSFSDNWRQYDKVLSRLYAHNHDCWHGIAPSNLHADFNPEPPIFAAKFANCNNYSHILAIANEDGKVGLKLFFDSLDHTSLTKTTF